MGYVKLGFKFHIDQTIPSDLYLCQNSPTQKLKNSALQKVKSEGCFQIQKHITETMFCLWTCAGGSVVKKKLKYQ